MPEMASVAQEAAFDRRRSPEYRKHFESQFDAMRRIRAPWETHWLDVRDYLMPLRGQFPGEKDRRADKTLGYKIYDGTAFFAQRTLAAGMHSGITSKTRPWIRLSLNDSRLSESDGPRRWLDEVTRRMLAVLAASNTYSALHTGYEEIGPWGNMCGLIVDDFQDVIRAHPITMGEYYWGTDHRDEVVACYREFNMTVRQIVRAFGLENTSTSVQNLYARSNYNEVVTVCQAIEPRDDLKPGVNLPTNYAYLSVYWEKGSSQGILQESGYAEKPFWAARWSVTASDVYGHGPGTLALPDVKQLQFETLKKGTAIDMIVDPPMIAPPELRSKMPQFTPRSVTFVNDTQGGRPAVRPAFDINPRLDALMEDIAGVQSRINQHFFADLFLMISNLPREVTAEEVRRRNEEKLVALGPVLERLDTELVSPIIDRLFGIMQRQGLIPPPPPEIEGMQIRVENVSILAQAQKLATGERLERGIMFAANVDGLRKINIGRAVEEYFDAIGASPRALRSEEEVAALEQQQQQAEAAAAMADMAKAGASAAKDLGQTDMGDGRNAIAAIRDAGQSAAGNQ